VTNEVQNAMWGMYDGLNAVRDDGTRRRAGSAIAGGDYAGGAQQLLSGGMLEDGMAVQGASQDMDRQEQADQLEFMREAAVMLRGVRDQAQGDPNALAQAWQGLVPVFQRMPGADPAMIDQYWQAIQADPGILDRIVPAIDYEIMNLGNGQTIAVDPANPQGFREITPARATPRPAPHGYRWNADETALEAIPGGPADTSVIAARGAAGRAPPRPRAAGGGGYRPPSGASGGSSGGGARPSSGGGLPAGFVPRRG
jgi:hypothetical protein